MLQQRTALFKARTDTVNNRSAQLHRYMVEPWQLEFCHVVCPRTVLVVSRLRSGAAELFCARTTTSVW